MTQANLRKEKIALRLCKKGVFKVCKDGTIINAKNNKQVGLSKVDDYGQVPFKDPKTGKWYSILTHRLVWIWFKGLITDASLEVNHEDGNKRNNAINNLLLGTSSYNNKHAYATGLNKISDKSKKLSSKRMKGKDAGNPLAKFSDRDVKLLRSQFDKKVISVNDVADNYGVTYKTAYNLLVGNAYSHLNDTNYVKTKAKKGRKEKYTRQEIASWFKMAKHLTLQEVSDIIGVHRTTVSKKLKNFKPNIKTFYYAPGLFLKRLKQRSK